VLCENINDLWRSGRLSRERSFTKAAATIGVPQSALSQTIRALEEQLGLRLVDGHQLAWRRSEPASGLLRSLSY